MEANPNPNPNPNVQETVPEIILEIVPENVQPQKRVFSQSEISEDDRDRNKAVLLKPLDLVWKYFPLYSQNNTVSVD
jgi:hypothetical protein